MRPDRRFVLGGLALLSATLLSGFSPEAFLLTLAVPADSTARWELAAMHELGIAKKHELELTINDVADRAAGQEAVLSKAADLTLSDVVWVSAQRHAGGKTAMVPYSLPVGGLMVDPAAGIDSVAALKGKTLAVAGGPNDGRFAILAADYSKATGGKLTSDATVAFGDAAATGEAFTTGAAQAALNLWDWNARAKSSGKAQLISLADMLADLGATDPAPLLGWTFLDDNATAKKKEFKAFLDASFETRKALLNDDDIWEKLRPAMNVGDDDALFTQLRDDYRSGIVLKYAPGNLGAAEVTYAALAQFAGPDAVGDATELAPGTFFKGYRK